VTARRRSQQLAAVCIGLLVLLSGCRTEEGAEESPAISSALSEADRKALVELAVGAGQLPPLTRTSESLTANDVIVQADLSDLGDALASTGFEHGVKLEYRGASPRLTGVESQVLAFASDAGAAEFSAYLAEHAGAFFGEPITVASIMVGDLEAWRIDPPVCDCAGAQPLSAGAVQVGSDVVVLQITGPKADPAMMKNLLVKSVDASS